MPWETNVFEQRAALIAAYRRGEVPMRELCRRYRVSRKTAYKWIKREKKEGWRGLVEGKRTPQGGRHWMGGEVREQIVQMRREHPRWGALKIVQRLRALHPRRKWPSASAAHRALTKAELVKRRKRGAPRVSGGSRLKEPTRPNEIWAVDFKGQFRTKDGKYCYPLTLTDGLSRFLLLCEGLLSIEAASSCRLLEAVLRTYGLPEAIHSDNGEPFASRALGGLSRMSVMLIRLGIRIERSRPGHPQDNGRHERMHRTLKDETTHPVGADLADQQAKFDTFALEYNHERPHQALAGRTPASLYRPSRRSYPAMLPELVYPPSFLIRRVKNRGFIKWQGQRLFVSEVLIGERVGLVRDEGLWLLYFGPVLLGRVHERKQRIVPTADMLAQSRRNARSLRRKPAPAAKPDRPGRLARGAKR